MSGSTNIVALELLVTLLVAGCASTPPSVFELPRPNSEQFTFAQAGARKSEIYSLAQSGLSNNWRNPYMGFCVHITPNDEVLVHSGTWPMIQGGKMSVSQLEAVLSKYTGMLLGNPLGVLITSERDPRSSSTLPHVVDLLFKPSVQIFYYKQPASKPGG